MSQKPGGREIREDGGYAGTDINMFTGHINFYHHAIYTLYSMSMIYLF